MKAINLNNLPFYQCSLTYYAQLLHSERDYKALAVTFFISQLFHTRTNSVTARGSINNTRKKIEYGGIDRSESSLKIVRKTCNILYTPFLTVYFWLRYFTITFFLGKEVKIGHGNIDR